MSYEVWHYAFVLEWATMNSLLGFELQDMQSAYDAGRTPRSAAKELYSSAVMRVIDRQQPLVQWVNNYVDRPIEMQSLNAPGCQITAGKDGNCWVLHFKMNGNIYGFLRSTPNAPAPPGYQG